MIEAELKYYVRKPEQLRSALEAHAQARHLRYNDQYYSHPSLDFTTRDAEFRIRQILSDHGEVRTVLTYKSDIADEATQSKSEFEVDIASAQSEMRTLVEAMGFVCYIEFEKLCQHFEFELGRHKVAATIVTLNETPDHFFEIESLVSRPEDVAAELEWLRKLSRSLDLPDTDQTIVTYEGTVADARRHSS